MNPILLLVFLAALAGIVAYTGDLLGTYVGKRRLSLFGFRPKQTGRFIGVIAGITIMVLTLGILAVVFQNATRTLFNNSNILTQNRILERQQESLTRQFEELQDQLTIQRESLAQIQADQLKLQEENASLNDENLSLQGINERLANDIELLQALNPSLINARIVLQGDLEQTLQQLESLKQQIAFTEDQGFAFTTGEVIHSRIISAQEPASIRNALTQFMIDAQNKVTLQGAESIKPLSTDDTEFLIFAIQETPNSDVLIFRSPENQVRSVREVDYFRDLVSNEKILPQGQLLTSRQVHLGSADLPVKRDEIVAELSRLSVTARTALLRLNALSDLELETTSLSPDIFAEQLLRLKGPVTIGMIASDDVFVAGPAKLEYAVIY